MYFSTYTAPLLNAARASFCARPKSWENCSASCTMRMPFPPPPAVALMITGKPIDSAKACASSGSSIVPGEPGTVGTPASEASRRAVALSPIWRIWSPVGPMKTMFDALQMSANSAFSARKP